VKTGTFGSAGAARIGMHIQHVAELHHKIISLFAINWSHKQQKD
jgi:hypothetical protein